LWNMDISKMLANNGTILPEKQRVIILENETAFLVAVEQLNTNITQYQNFCDTPQLLHTIWTRASTRDADNTILNTLRWLHATLLCNPSMSGQVITEPFSRSVQEPPFKQIINTPVIQTLFERSNAFQTELVITPKDAVFFRGTIMRWSSAK